MSIDKARKNLIITNGLIDEYTRAINSYDKALGKELNVEKSKKIFKDVFKKRKANN